METSFAIQPAATADRPALMALLREAGLPTQDLPASLENFRVVRTEHGLAGSVGIEPLGDVALLRSLAVSTVHRGTGLGTKLYRAALERAAQLGLKSVYLITTTADAFFEKQGFVRLQREATPAAVQGTAQFSGVCPSSAVVMRKTIGG